MYLQEITSIFKVKTIQLVQANMTSEKITLPH